MSETIHECFLEVAARQPTRPALLYPRNGVYQTLSYGGLCDRVASVAGRLQDLGIGSGDRVAIISSNRPEWVVADLAVLALGGIVVPIYANMPASYIAYVINDAGVALVFIEHAGFLSRFEEVRARIPSVRRVVLFEDPGVDKRGEYLLLRDLEEGSPPIPSRRSAITSDDVASIVYTSGTTGEPKGVMLTHRNIVANARGAASRFDAGPNDVFLSFLPLCHMFERTCGYYTILFAGATVAYAQDITTVAKDAEKIRPTLVAAVPRVLEKVFETVSHQVESSPPVQRRLFMTAIRVLNEYANRSYRKMNIPFGLKLRRALFDRMVASKLRRIGGGRIRAVVCGSASLRREVAKLLYIFGFPILEGYGLTEASPVVCSNSLGDNTLGTVGKPFPGVTIRIGAENEVLVKGPNVMKGYLNKPAETARAIDPEGWLHTGDQGRFDAGGNLVITGRIKELIVTSYGAKVAAAAVEESLCRSRYIEQAVVCGEGRKHLIALLVPKKDQIEQFARSQGMTIDNYETLLERYEVRTLMAEEMAAAVRDRVQHERPKGFALLREGFTLENLMLTPTLKVRRNEVFRRYHRLIEEIYEEADGGHPAIHQ
jgi:long-chain acyl-CoA synthetase